MTSRYCNLIVIIFFLDINIALICFSAVAFQNKSIKAKLSKCHPVWKLLYEIYLILISIRCIGDFP